MLINSPLLTDQYELVMAHGYWHLGMAERKAVFQLVFRSHPFGGNYTIACGLNRVIEFLSNWKFSESDLDYIASLQANDQATLFPGEFIDYLKKLRFSCSVDAIPEGTVVFPKEPLLRIEGPLLQCQLLETALINLIQFPSLVATNAAHLYLASEKGQLVEFGLRRAQGPDGGVTVSRSAYIGGCVGTSNLLAGKLYDIPVFGTQAHSWIMAFDHEAEAFEQFAQIQPHNIVFLVDTYSTHQGIEHAIETGNLLKKQGLELRAIRLDSGDLLALSQYARHRLDQAGFQKTRIMVSGDLNEAKILALKKGGAPIDLWGVGTNLSACTDSPYLNTAYKLAAIQNKQQQWEYKRKISDTAQKASIPGIHRVRRYYENAHYRGDILYDKNAGLTQDISFNHTHSKELLEPIFQEGRLIYSEPDIHQIKKLCTQNLEQFLADYGGNQPYPVALDKSLKSSR